ncbi:hypothetical protein PCC7811_04430 [Planktothrix agardhii]|nr:hypothetical protein PCC7811_04430 [Planktothrix agardhii]
MVIIYFLPTVLSKKMIANSISIMLTDLYYNVNILCYSLLQNRIRLRFNAALSYRIVVCTLCLIAIISLSGGIYLSNN